MATYVFEFETVRVNGYLSKERISQCESLYGDLRFVVRRGVVIKAEKED